MRRATIFVFVEFLTPLHSFSPLSSDSRCEVQRPFDAVRIMISGESAILLPCLTF